MEWVEFKRDLEDVEDLGGCLEELKGDVEVDHDLEDFDDRFVICDQSLEA